MGAENNFMEYAQIVFYQLVIFVIYGAIGVAAVRGGILDEAGLHPSGSMHGSQRTGCLSGEKECV